MKSKRLWLAAGVAWFSAGGPAACAAPPQWGYALEGNPLTREQLAAETRAAGVPAGLIVFFLQWPEEVSARSFPRASLDAIAAAGALPVITWEPMYYRRSDNVETMIPAARIVRGDYDGYLEDFARQAAAWGRPVIVRLAHEMNLSRYHWGGTAGEYGPESPARFRAIWRHVVGVFRRANATNVRWAFCPNCESVPGVGDPAAARWNTIRSYYPGDDWVDVLGMDGYNWGNSQTPEKHGWRSSWRSFRDTFAGAYGELRKLAPAKPLFVFETACAPSGGDKSAWLAGLVATSRIWKLDGVVWFQVSKEVDWRLQTAAEPAALASLRTAFPLTK